MSQIKRRWSVRAVDRVGQPAYLFVTVPEDDGTVHITVTADSLTVPADRIERMRQVLGEARAAALWDRGSW